FVEHVQSNELILFLCGRLMFAPGISLVRHHVAFLDESFGVRERIYIELDPLNVLSLVVDIWRSRAKQPEPRRQHYNRKFLRLHFHPQVPHCVSSSRSRTSDGFNNADALNRSNAQDGPKELSRKFAFA